MFAKKQQFIVHYVLKSTNSSTLVSCMIHAFNTVLPLGLIMVVLMRERTNELILITLRRNINKEKLLIEINRKFYGYELIAML